MKRVVAGLLLFYLPSLASAFSSSFHNRHINNNNNVDRRRTATIAVQSFAAASDGAVFVDIDENAIRDVGTFDEWTINCGVQRSEGFQLLLNEPRDDGTGGILQNDDYSVITTEPIEAGSPVLYVPNEMMFTAAKIRTELGTNYGPQVLEDAEQYLTAVGVDTEYFPQYYLFLKVLMEYELGTNSNWYIWLNSLPRKFTSGASMTPYCFECLPPLTSKLSSNERVKFIYFFKSLFKIPFVSDETKQNQDLSKWAYNIVYTRCFGSTLVPMADMFNHATQANVEIQYDDADPSNCYVYSNQDIPENSSLFLSYGEPTNPSHLFATYGFLDESSPATFCKIMNIKSTPELQNLGLDFTRMLFYTETGDITTEVWDVLLYTILEERNEKQIQSQFYTAHMNDDAETKNAIHAQYFAYTSKKLKHHVDTFLQELDQLSGKALTKDVRVHPRIPIILQHNEFVKQTFLKVQMKLNEMMMG